MMNEEQSLEIQNNQNKIVEYDNIDYLINEEENTAGVFNFHLKQNQEHFIIPQSIKQGSKEYEVTSFLYNSSNESTGNKLYRSGRSNEKFQIRSLTIPSGLVDLRENWCKYTDGLTKITIDPNNPRYCLYEDKMVLGKTKIEQSNYDCLLFCVRDIEYIKIPNFIEHIYPYAFEKCFNLKNVEFPSDSKLQTIGKYSFVNSIIESISIPSSVTIIGEYAFGSCKKLQTIEIPQNSKLRTIGDRAFFFTQIKSLMIPSELVDLKEEWCSMTIKLTKIEVSPLNPRYCFFDDKMILGKTRIEQNYYDCLIFCVRDAKSFQIPTFIEHICPCAFNHCQGLQSVEIQPDSKLQTIEFSAFNNSSINSISIPSSVTYIGKFAFFGTINLRQIEIPDDSKLQTIDSDALFVEIENLTIPSGLVDLREDWCSLTKRLTTIRISPNNPRYRLYENKMIIGKTNIEQSNYDCLIFCVRDAKRIQIPSFIEHICSSSFNFCNQLETIDFTSDSRLKTIDRNAFANSSIKRIAIPSSVTSIGYRAFMSCRNLQRFDIPDDSKLQKIDIGAFDPSDIRCFTVPSSLTFVGNFAFSNFQIMEIKNAEIISKYPKSFMYCKNTLIMIPAHSKLRGKKFLKTFDFDFF